MMYSATHPGSVSCDMCAKVIRRNEKHRHRLAKGNRLWTFCGPTCKKNFDALLKQIRFDASRRQLRPTKSIRAKQPVAIPIIAEVA